MTVVVVKMLGYIEPAIIPVLKVLDDDDNVKQEGRGNKSVVIYHRIPRLRSPTSLKIRVWGKCLNMPLNELSTIVSSISRATMLIPPRLHHLKPPHSHKIL